MSKSFTSQCLVGRFSHGMGTGEDSKKTQSKRQKLRWKGVTANLGSVPANGSQGCFGTPRKISGPSLFWRFIQ